MTLTTYTPARYTGTNSTAVYPFAFRILQDADLVVIQTDLGGVESTLALTADYTVTGAGSYSGGSITLLAGDLPTGYGLTLKRVVGIAQPTSIRNQGAFFPEIHENVFDRLTMIDQQQESDIEELYTRSFGTVLAELGVAPSSSSFSNASVGSGDGSRFAFIATNASGIPVINPSPSSILRTDWPDTIPNTGTLQAFGDSITVGYYATVPYTTNGWVYLYAAGKGVAVSNHAVAGDQVADQMDDIYALTVGATQGSTVFLGTNDHRYYGVSYSKKVIFTDCYRDALAWLALPSTAKFNSRDAGVTYGGTWTDSNLFAANMSKRSIVNGSTATFSVTGDVVYVSMTVELSGGSYTIKVDGVTQGTYSTDPGAAPLTQNGVAIAARLHRFTGFSTGAHTIVITKTDATAAPIYFNWAAGRVSASAAPGPKVNAANLYRLNTGGWGSSNIDNLGDYNTVIASVIAQLQADGLSIKAVDLFNVVDLTTDLNGDNLHPNDSGHQKIATAFTGVHRINSQGYAIRSSMFVMLTAPPTGSTLAWSGTGSTTFIQAAGGRFSEDVTFENGANVQDDLVVGGVTRVKTIYVNDPTEISPGVDTGAAVYEGGMTIKQSLQVYGNAALFGPRAPKPGYGGSFRLRDDTGTIRYQVGFTGGIGDSTFHIYDAANSVDRFQIDSTGNVLCPGTFFPQSTTDITAGTANSGSLRSSGGITAAKSIQALGNVIAVGPGSASSGNGGSFRTRNDAGTASWLMGHLGSGGAVNWVLYDQIAADSPITVVSGAGGAITIARNTKFTGTIGFNNTSPIAKPTVSGAKGSNAALASLITALVNYGLITDTTTA